jgi:MoxR-like ATPase
MDYPYFTGAIDKRYRRDPVPIPAGLRTTHTNKGKCIGGIDVSGYDVDTALMEAINVSILLGRPLLLTGEPGTGKTELAYVIASELGFNSVEKFETKSTSTAVDLFYHYNMIGRFHAAQIGKKEDIEDSDFIAFNALGKAILHSLALEAIKKYLPKKDELSGEYAMPRQSVVLIDEIDKAPLDFPNDILNEIERMEFRIPELNNATITADPQKRPVVVMTSNSEKHLPDAFLRRCIYYNIEFPNEKRLKEIIRKQAGLYVDNEPQFLDDLLNFFSLLREEGCGIQKKPATAELLDWIVALKKISRDKPNPLRDNKEKVISSLSCLLKNADDLAIAQKMFEEQWRPKS